MSAPAKLPTMRRRRRDRHATMQEPRDNRPRVRRIACEHLPGQAPPGWAKKILHAGLASGDGVLEGCDAMPGQYMHPESFCVMLRPKEAAEADRIFKALAEGGTVQIPIAETFWALRFGQVVDRFGVPWLVNCEKPAAENVA